MPTKPIPTKGKTAAKQQASGGRRPSSCSALGECRLCGSRSNYPGGRSVNVPHIAFGGALMETFTETNDDEYWQLAKSPCCGSSVDFIEQNAPMEARPDGRSIQEGSL
jgi:hypothetical protein